MDTLQTIDYLKERKEKLIGLCYDFIPVKDLCKISFEYQNYCENNECVLQIDNQEYLNELSILFEEFLQEFPICPYQTIYYPTIYNYETYLLVNLGHLERIGYGFLYFFRRDYCDHFYHKFQLKMNFKLQAYFTYKSGYTWRSPLTWPYLSMSWNDRQYRNREPLMFYCLYQLFKEFHIDILPPKNQLLESKNIALVFSELYSFVTYQSQINNTFIRLKYFTEIQTLKNIKYSMYNDFFHPLFLYSIIAN